MGNCVRIIPIINFLSLSTSILFQDVEDSSSEEEQNEDVRSKKKNSDVQDADEPMNSANQSPQNSPSSVRKMSLGSDNSDVPESKKERDHKKGQQICFNFY